MDFEDTPEESAFRAEARAFLDAHAPAGGLRYGEMADMTERVERQRAWQRELHEHGWSVPTWPKQWGGRALTPAQHVIWQQELSRVGVGEGVFNGGLSMLGPTLVAHGSEEQKSRFLEPTARGDILWAQLFSEPSSGSDLASLGTRAVADGNDFVVNGQKVWSSFANHADWGFLLVLRRLGRRAHQQETPVCVVRERGPDLLAVHHELVAVGHRTGAERGEVGARRRLAEELRPEDVAARGGLQETGLLRLAAVRHERGAQHREPAVEDALPHPDARELLLPDHALGGAEAAAAPLPRPGGDAPAVLV